MSFDLCEAEGHVQKVTSETISIATLCSVSLTFSCDQTEWRLLQVFTPVVWSLITFNRWRLVLGSIQHLFERLRTNKTMKGVNGILLHHWYQRFFCDTPWSDSEIVSKQWLVQIGVGFNVLHKNTLTHGQARRESKPQSSVDQPYHSTTVLWNYNMDFRKTSQQR